ncbi:hypothetical protein [Thermosediminibacter oceani]|nr:hypothetical protein [Thermosediminibacter oceani]
MLKLDEKIIFRVISGETKVLQWLEENFDLSQFKVEDFPLFPAGKRIIDKNGEEMVVFWDFLYDRIEYFFQKINQ